MKRPMTLSSRQSLITVSGCTISSDSGIVNTVEQHQLEGSRREEEEREGCTQVAVWPVMLDNSLFLGLPIERW